MRVEVVAGAVEARVGRGPGAVAAGPVHGAAGRVGRVLGDVGWDGVAGEEPDADAVGVDEGGEDAAFVGVEGGAVGGDAGGVGHAAADVFALVGRVDVAVGGFEVAFLGAACVVRGCDAGVGVERVFVRGGVVDVLEDVDFAGFGPGGGAAEDPVGWPGAAYGGGHVEDIGEDEGVVEGLVAGDAGSGASSGGVGGCVVYT